MGFEKYDDSQRAERIWKEYQSDLDARGLNKAAMNILDECTRCNQLDVRLDMLISCDEMLRRGGGNAGPLDSDSGGYSANARMQLEDYD